MFKKIKMLVTAGVAALIAQPPDVLAQSIAHDVLRPRSSDGWQTGATSAGCYTAIRDPRGTMVIVGLDHQADKAFVIVANDTWRSLVPGGGPSRNSGCADRCAGFPAGSRNQEMDVDHA
jgi:hypothetical protein